MVTSKIQGISSVSTKNLYHLFHYYFSYKIISEAETGLTQDLRSNESVDMRTLHSNTVAK